MTTEWKLPFVPVEDYLASEETSPVKHEYIGGVLYARVGARNRHNLIAMNLAVSIAVQLRGKPCRAFNSDTKIRLQFPTHIRFSYPDASVICQQNSLDDSFQDCPRVIFEVLSRRTRRLDEGEEKDAYLAIPALAVYVLVEQDFPSGTLHRRTDRVFVQEIHSGIESVIPLSEVGVSLPLSEVYEGMETSFEEPPDDDDD